MRWCFRFLLVALLSLLVALPAMAATPGFGIPVPINPGLRLPVNTNTPVAFGAVPNRYTNVDPATIFDLNGDLVGDLKVSSTTVTGQNGTMVQLLEPAVLSLDQVQKVPTTGYMASSQVMLSRVYVAQIAGGGYAKFMLLQASPKVTIWFHFGMPTTSELTVDGTGGHAVLNWGALGDAELGYNIYRYEFLEDNAYTVTLLNDFTVQATTFTDETAKNHYYLWVVVAIKAGGAFGSQTTVAPANVQSLQRSLVISLSTASAKLDGVAVPLAKPPVIKNGRLMVPASLLTSVGVGVSFDSGTGRVTMTRKLDSVTYTMTMTVNEPQYTWNGSGYQADVPPYKDGTEVMVPLRVVVPALGFGLSFNSTDRTASIQWFE